MGSIIMQPYKIHSKENSIH